MTLTRRDALRTAGRWCLAGGAATLGACAAPRSNRDAGAAASGPTNVIDLERPVAVPLQRGGAYHFLPVAVDGEPAGSWLLDTGSSITLVELGVARRLGLEARDTGTVTGIGGTQPIGWLGPRSVTFGDVRVDLARLGRLNLYELNRRIDFPLSGIVGFDALARGPVTLDPRGDRPTLRFHPRDGFRPEPGANDTRLRRWGGLPVIDVELAAGRVAPVIVDSGQDGALTLPRSLAERWPGVFAAAVSGPGGSVGVGGTASGSRTWVRRVDALGFRWRDVPVKIEDNASIGRIGMPLIRKLTLSFDAPRGRVYAAPA